jgi:hypothetical protein
MGWTTPRTWVDGELATATLLNTHLRDNLDWLNARKWARVYKSATQSVNDATQTVLTFDSETADTDGFHSTVSNTGRLTIPSGLDGLYLVVGQVEWATNATGNRRAFVMLNGATELAAVRAVAFSGTQASQQGMAVYPAVAGDYFTLEGFQNSGGALNANATTTWFSCVRLFA